MESFDSVTSTKTQLSSVLSLTHSLRKKMYRSRLLFIRSSTSLTTRTKTTHGDDVLFKIRNKTGIITLNRPNEFNCLTTPMLAIIISKLQEWQKDKALIITKGAGGKAFSVGGDVKIICENSNKGRELFWHEFKLVSLINNCQIPYVSFVDGYTIGAGLAISIAGKYRIATEKTVMSMPEVTIGLCPSLGATYIFPRLRHNIGYYLGFTGHKLRGSDTVYAGLATHFVPHDRIVDLEINLSKCSDEHEILTVLNKFCVFRQTNGSCSSVAPHLKDIDYCFSAPTLEDLFTRLEKISNDWSKKTLQELLRVSPTILKVTYRAFESGAKMNFLECLLMEFGITDYATQNHDFKEGIRSQFIDKDNNPDWSPKTLTEVDDAYVDKFFAKCPPPKPFI